MVKGVFLSLEEVRMRGCQSFSAKAGSPSLSPGTSR